MTLAVKRKKPLSLKPSSQFENALRRLQRCKSSKKKCDLIKNCSDEFIRDLEIVIHRCLPIYNPLSGTYLNKVKMFSNSKVSNSRRRKMMQHGSGTFLGMLKDFGESMSHLINSPMGKTLLSLAPLALL